MNKWIASKEAWTETEPQVIEGLLFIQASKIWERPAD